MTMLYTKNQQTTIIYANGERTIYTSLNGVSYSQRADTLILIWNDGTIKTVHQAHELYSRISTLYGEITL